MREEDLTAWADSLTPEEMRGHVIGLTRADVRHKQKIFRQERSLLGMLDKIGKLHYELERLENTLVECHKRPEHSKTIVQRAIPKRIYKEML